MEFLNPGAFLGLLALPLLLIPYLVRRKPRRVVFSSILLFIESGSRPITRPFGRINLPPLFFLQLLLLALLIFAVSEPVFSVRPTSVAVILDNSASMQARENGASRLARAQERIAGVLGELGTATAVDLYTTTPRLTKLNPTPVSPLGARGAIRNIPAYDLGDPPIDYDQALAQLAREQKYQRVYLVTDHPATGQSATVRVLSVGQPQGNLAIISFDLQRTSLLNSRMHASATVANFSSRDEKFQVHLKYDGAVLMSRNVTLPADQRATISFDGFAERPSYEIEIDAQDALALDNRRYAVAPVSRNLRVLAVTPRPPAAATLKNIHGVSVDTISPAEYGKVDRIGYGVEIFHYAAPAELPENPALFILPPDSSSLVDLGQPVSQAAVSSWREPHQLTRYVNFNLLRPAYARPLRPQVPGQMILEGPNGLLAFAVEQRGLRYLVLGFDPLPYLGRENLPMSVFTLNVLDWFLESGGARNQATGEPIPLGSGGGDALINPAGERLTPAAGAASFSETYRQGIYRRVKGAASDSFARNFDDLGESDLRSSAAITIRGSGAATGTSSVLFSFWPYLLLASLVLLAIEWFVWPRSAAGVRPARAMARRSKPRSSALL